MRERMSCAACESFRLRQRFVTSRRGSNRYNRPTMPIDWFPLWLSLRVAGLWIAYLLANREFRGKEVLDAAVTLPLVLPPTVLGYYLLVVIGRTSPFGKLWEAVFGPPPVFTWKAAVFAALLHAFPLLVKSSS